MKQVVIKRLLKQEDSTLNRQFEDIAGFYGFKPVLCRPYRGQTRGNVINLHFLFAVDTEIQLRDDSADAFAWEMAKEPDALGEQAFALLKSNLRFVIPDPNENNRSRWKTCRFWERFLGTVKPLKMTIDKPDSTLVDTINWLKTGGALSAVRAFQFLEEHDALGGLSTVDEMMQDVKFSNNLVNKLTAHLMEIGRGDLIPMLRQHTNAE